MRAACRIPITAYTLCWGSGAFGDEKGLGFSRLGKIGPRIRDTWIGDLETLGV